MFAACRIFRARFSQRTGISCVGRVRMARDEDRRFATPLARGHHRRRARWKARRSAPVHVGCRAGRAGHRGRGRCADREALMDAREKVRAWRREATDDPEGFWGRAAEQVPWFKKWERVLDWEPPTFRWYSGGLSNLAYNCVDHHVAASRGDHVALITENERGERRTLTSRKLHRETSGQRGPARVSTRRPHRDLHADLGEAMVLMLRRDTIGVVILVVSPVSRGCARRAHRLAGAAPCRARRHLRKGKDVQILASSPAVADARHRACRRRRRTAPPSA